MDDDGGDDDDGDDDDDEFSFFYSCSEVCVCVDDGRMMVYHFLKT